jgi:hypothetical protein
LSSRLAPFFTDWLPATNNRGVDAVLKSVGEGGAFVTHSSGAPGCAKTWPGARRNCSRLLNNGILHHGYQSHCSQ